MVASTQQMRLLDSSGNPMPSIREVALARAHGEIHRLRRKMQGMNLLNGKYDAAQTFSGNEKHWANVDRFDPHTANSLPVRKFLRTRSRYEIIENNPYLKGTVLTVANDFVGSGPSLQITDQRIPKSRRKELCRIIEDLFYRWFEACSLRQKLWRLRLAKLVDGEGFMFAFNNIRRKIGHEDCPIPLDFFLVESDQVSKSDTFTPNNPDANYFEIDGVRWDRYNNPLYYYLLDNHPGNNFIMSLQEKGKWVNSNTVIHWFRQDRGWLRGIPEATPSLPLCAMLRRYTLSVVRAAEIAADFSAVLETEGPPNANAWQTDENGDPLEDDPFDVFPIEMGMFTTLPWGYKLSQLKAEQPIQLYDMFVDALLREIMRPLLVPFHMAAGSSKDSNMSSAVLDTHIYKTGQAQERISCEEGVINPLFCMWFNEARFIPGYLPKELFRYIGPRGYPTRRWRWDSIGLDHTDPQKVMEALKTAHDKGFMTDRDIQEGRFNRDVETWREEYAEDLAFRKTNQNMGMRDAIPQAPSTNSATLSKKKVKAKHESYIDENEETSDEHELQEA